MVVTIDGEHIEAEQIPLLMVYNKPLGTQSTMRDNKGRQDLSAVLFETPVPWQKVFHPVGRLDADTSGLLLFSSRGDLTHRLLHPKRKVEKEYSLVCRPQFNRDTFMQDLKHNLAKGVPTATGKHVGHLLDVVPAKDDLVKARVSVTEGKHRMVRRMMANLGAPVLQLRRDRFGPIPLGDLQPGDLLPVSYHDHISWAKQLLGEEPDDDYEPEEEEDDAEEEDGD